MTMDFTMDFYDYCMDGWKFEFQMGFVSCNMIDSEVKCRVSEYQSTFCLYEKKLTTVNEDTVPEFYVLQYCTLYGCLPSIYSYASWTTNVD